MNRIPPIDAFFLDLETAVAPMNVAMALILGPADAGDPGLREALQQRLFRSPPPFAMLRERVGRDRWGRYCWVDAGSPDPHAHLVPGSWPRSKGPRQLEALLSELVARPLDLRRPPWRVDLVEGVPLPGMPGAEGSLILVLGHHAAIDGYSLCHWVRSLVDPTSPTSLRPGPADLLADPTDGWQALGQRFRASIGGWREASKLAARGEARWPPMPNSGPRTPFDAPISRRRTLAFGHFELDRLNRVRHRFGATINDLVLALCADASRRWLADLGKLPARSLVALVPAASGPPARTRRLGNHVSPMLITLATDEADPRRRLMEIRRNASSAKALQRAWGGHGLADLLRLLPPRALARASVRSFGFGRFPGGRPCSNISISNLRSDFHPQARIAGRRILARVPILPIHDGLGPSVSILGGASELCMTVLACPTVLPDPDRFLGAVERALCDLEGQNGPSPARPTGTTEPGLPSRDGAETRWPRGAADLPRQTSARSTDPRGRVKPVSRNRKR